MWENRALDVGKNRGGCDAQHIPMLLGEREADGETRSNMGCGAFRAGSWGGGSGIECLPRIHQ